MSATNFLPPQDYDLSPKLANGDVPPSMLLPAKELERGAQAPPAARPCPKCRGLDLSVAQFNVQSGQPGRQRFSGGRGGAGVAPSFSTRYANSRFPLGTYREIASRGAAGCAFCRLVFRSVDETWLSTGGSSGLEDTNCFLTWELDGRSIDENNQTIQARTRRIHIHWDNGAIPDAFAIFLTPRVSSKLVTTDEHAVWTTSDHFLARRIDQEASKIALIRSWLEQCLHEHKGSCIDGFERGEGGFRRVAKAAHFGVLDIVEMRLTSLPLRSKGKTSARHRKSNSASASDDSSDDELYSDLDEPLFEPYVALSYVWGSKEDQDGFEALRTKLNNVLTRGFQHAIEEDFKRMPKVIQSSVELVRRLGYRYLWIDSICIVQDSHRSWIWNSQVMDRIYSNAEFTICAADGNNARAGLVAFDSPEASSGQIIETIAQGVRLMIVRDVESQIASSAWNSRAWTFQERLLSHRCLIFTQGRVFFQCRKATFSEDIVTSPQASKTSAWSLDLVRSPLVLLNKLRERPFWFYMHCVELFSGRDLTNSTDVLAAFNGVSNLIESAMTGPLSFGLPTSHFDLALLWTPHRALTRRKGGDFPSWSWCGWEGGSATFFNQEFIQDCLENVHQWLISHTWIQWHIRDARSKLRPLWLTCERVLKANEELRWKGYDSHEFAQEQCYQQHLVKMEKTERRKCELENRLRMLHEENKRWNMSSRKDRRFGTGNVDNESDSGASDSDSSQISKPPLEIRARIEPEDYDERRCQRIAEERTREEWQRRLPDYRMAPLLSREENDSKAKLKPKLDPYGRLILEGRRGKAPKFRKRAPESPFALYKAQFTSKVLTKSDSPILQFWTDSVWLYLIEPNDHSETDTGDSESKGGCGPGLQRYGIADAAGDWCGSIVLSEDWAHKNMRQTRSGGETAFEFLALSNAKRFTKEECETWSYYVPFDRQQSEWDLNYVMLVQVHGGVRYRVGVGKIFRHALRNGAKGKARWEEIVLG